MENYVKLVAQSLLLPHSSITKLSVCKRTESGWILIWMKRGGMPAQRRIRGRLVDMRVIWYYEKYQLNFYRSVYEVLVDSMQHGKLAHRRITKNRCSAGD